MTLATKYMLDFAIAQQRPILIYDSHYPSIAIIAPYARDRGYDVHIFAPGFLESSTLNILDLLKDSADSFTAYHLATTIQKIGLTTNSNISGFSALSSVGLIQAVLMLTKEFDCDDILTASAILKSDRLTEKLINVNLNPWIQMAFGQLFSTVGTRTNAEIIATASLTLSNFLATQATLNCFIGKTTLPYPLKPKQLIIFGLNTHKQDASALLISSILHVLITDKRANQPFQPSVFTTDELPLISQFKHTNVSVVDRVPDFHECNQENWEKLTTSINHVSNQHFSLPEYLDRRKTELEKKLTLQWV